LKVLWTGFDLAESLHPARYRDNAVASQRAELKAGNVGGEATA
jgi:hypothetical protein